MDIPFNGKDACSPEGTCRHLCKVVKGNFSRKGTCSNFDRSVEIFRDKKIHHNFL